MVLVANEGEPNADLHSDPEGSVSVINLKRGVELLKNDNVRTARFDVFNEGRPRHRELDRASRSSVRGRRSRRTSSPSTSRSRPTRKRRGSPLQENNALAVIRIQSARVKELLPLGTKDHALPGNELDASNRDDTINIARWPVQGMYQPDAIARLQVGAETFLVTANEGDTREYDTFVELEQVRNLELDPVAFPNADELQEQPNIGRLVVTTANGDANGDGKYEQLFAFGARSFSIWSAGGALVWDSGSDLERITAATFPADFNSTDDENGSFDDRSDNKGPEPEGVTIGEIGGRQYAFVALERIGGVVVYGRHRPRTHRPSCTTSTTRDFGGDAEAARRATSHRRACCSSPPATARRPSAGGDGERGERHGHRARGLRSGRRRHAEPAAQQRRRVVAAAAGEHRRDTGR